VCQGFSYGSEGTFVTFKGQQPDDALNMADNACNSPNNTFWALNAGKCAQSGCSSIAFSQSADSAAVAM